MILGIIVEGPSDEAAYSALIRRVRPEVGGVLARPCGGKSPLRRNFVAFLEEFESLAVAKSLVIRDSDCSDPRNVEARLEEKLRDAGFRPSVPFHFYATHCMVDTWLLADEGAVNRVAQRRGRRSAAARSVPDPLEGRRDAKAAFRRMLSQAGLLASPAVYAEVACDASLDLISRRCPRFRQFVGLVHAC